MAITINVSEDTAASAGGDYPAIPGGTYPVTIKKVKLGEYKSGNNQGKPFYNVQFRISDGEYAGRVLFTMVGLFDKWAPTTKNPQGAANFTMTNFFKALGYDVKSGEFVVPSIDELAGQALSIRVIKKKDAENNMADSEGYVNDVDRFIAANEGETTATASASITSI